MIDYTDMKEIVEEATGCILQHNGWTCGTCFFSISSSFNNKDWQNILLFRGDYKEKDLDNLPSDRIKSLEKVYSECERYIND